METVAAIKFNKKKRECMCIPFLIFQFFIYLKRSLIFDQFVGGVGWTIAFLPSFEISDFCTAFRESVPEVAGWAKANTINARMVIVAIVIFFMVKRPF